MGKPNGGISQNKKKDGQEERAEREKKKKLYSRVVAFPLTQKLAIVPK